MSPAKDWQEVRRKYSNKRYHKRKRWIDKYKVAQGCEFCGYNAHPAALDFDHVDPSTKKFLIVRNLNCNLKKLIAEMRKCRILCANCHRVHSREQWNTGVTYKPNPRKQDTNEPCGNQTVTPSSAPSSLRASSIKNTPMKAAKHGQPLLEL